MNNLMLNNDIIAISRIDFNGEEWNYFILSKDRVFNDKQLYKVQWWSKSMNFFWSKYSLSFDKALSSFYKKIDINSSNIELYINEPISNEFSSIHEPREKNDFHIDKMDKDQRTKLEWSEMINKQYMREKLVHWIELLNEQELTIDDLNETLGELQ